MLRWRERAWYFPSEVERAEQRQCQRSKSRARQCRQRCEIAESRLHCRLVFDLASTAGVDGFSFLDVGDEPSHDALPAFGVTCSGGSMARETFLADS